MWTGLFKTSSSVKGGMLYQLQNQRNVVSDPRNDVNSCEDFFLLPVTANILAVTMEVFGEAESE